MNDTQLAFDIDSLADECELVHGIVSLDPPTVRCDGCGFEAVGTTGKAGVLILTCGILFNPLAYSRGDRRRLCSTCGTEAGWSA